MDKMCDQLHSWINKNETNIGLYHVTGNSSNLKVQTLSSQNLEKSNNQKDSVCQNKKRYFLG